MHARALAAVVSLLPAVAGATISEPNFTETVFASGLGQITGIDWAPDGSNRLFVIQKTGQVRIVKDGTLLVTPFATETVYTSSECGLIGFTFDPRFTSNGFVYLFITVSSSEQQIVRYRAAGDVGVERTVIVTGLPTRGVNHDGGGLGFGPDGKLYWSIGDNGSGVGVGPDLSVGASKVSRANPDGTPVADNPFNDGPGPNNDYIWARGFRNPYTLTFQRSTGQLWVNTVGTNYEQVFLPQRGDHAGWNAFENNQPVGYLAPVIVYRTNGTDSRTLTSASRSGNTVTFTTTPVEHGFRKGGKITVAGVSPPSFNGDFYVRSVPTNFTFIVDQIGPDATGSSGTATTQNIGGCITGGTFYDASALPAEYDGNFFFGDYNSGQLVRVKMSPGSTTIGSVDFFGSGITNVTDMAVGPDGALYYASISAGTIRRAEYNNPAQKLIVSSRFVWLRENGRIGFSVSLATDPGGPVTVSLARAGDPDVLFVSPTTLTFNSSNYRTPQAVVLESLDDADGTDEQATITVSLAGVPNESVLVNNYDDDQLSLVVSPISLAITEGGSGTATVKLTLPPAAPLTVSATIASGDPDITVTGGATLVFDASNYDTPQTVTVSAAQDADLTNDTATLRISAPGLASRDVPVTATDDDPQAPQITSTPVTTVVVNATYRYDVDATGNPAPTYFLGTRPSGMSINGTTGVITWTPTATGSAAVTVRGVNGINPEATQSFTITVNPDVAPVCTLTQPQDGSTVSGATAELYGDGIDDVGAVKAEFYVDGTLRYTDLASPVVARGHFHYGGDHLRWDTTALSDGPHALQMKVYDTIGQTCSAGAQVTVDNLPLGLVVSPPALSLTEGGVGTVTVRLSEPPPGPVTVSAAIAVGDADITVTGGASLSFDASNYATPQPVTVAAAQDADLTNDTATLRLTAGGLSPVDVPVTAIDDDPRAPQITSSPVTTVVVNTNYQYDVEATGIPSPTFSLTAPPAGMGIDASTGLITWAPSATGAVTVTVVASNGVSPDATQSFTLTVQPDARPGCTLRAPLDGSTVSGAAADFSCEGVDDVGLVKADFYVDGTLRYSETVAPGILQRTFHYGGAPASWDTTMLSEGSHLVEIKVWDTANQSTTARAQVMVDNVALRLVVSPAALSIDEGGSGAVAVRLSEPPRAAITVSAAIASGDADVTVTGGASLSFDSSNYDVPQNVTVAAAQDPDATNDAATLRLTAAGLSAVDVPVSVLDDDPRAPQITSTPVTSVVVNTRYEYDVEATGFPAPTFSLGSPPAGMTIDAATGVISWAPTATGSVTVTVVASNGVSPDATQTFTMMVSPDAVPLCTLIQPQSGSTVSGATANFFGETTDDVGMVKAEFYVDGALRYTDPASPIGPVQRFHYGGAPASWDTTALSEGPHTVQMKAYDTAGQTCVAEAQVVVDNVMDPPDGGSGMDGGTGTDGGTGGEVDGGVDGGTGGDNPPGCGCSQGGHPLTVLALALAVVLRARGRRAARRRIG